VMRRGLNSPDRISILSNHLSWVNGSRIQESDPIQATECEVFEGIQLTESAFDSEKGILYIVILKPGLNRSGTHFYTEKALKESAEKFAGVKMYADHISRSGAKDRPERSIRDFVGVVKESFL